MFAGDHYPASLSALDGGTPLGHALLRAGHFRFAAGWANVNGGGNGATPRCLVECKRHWEDRFDGAPDAFVRYELPKAYARCLDAIAADVNCADSGCLAIVDNASTAISAVFRSLRWRPGDKLLLLSCAYGTVHKVAAYLRDTAGVETVCVPVRFPFDQERLLSDVEQALRENAGSIKLASFSHVTAQPAVVLPVRQLQAMCTRHGAMCFVDAAHAYGQIAIDLADIAPDFYAANGHKWAFVPRAAAFLYVRAELRHLVHPAVISFGYGHGFHNEFRYVGTRDYSAWLTFPAAIEFRRRLGAGRIADYTHRLAVEAAALVARIWGTEVLNGERHCASMADVRLPTDDAVLAERCADKLMLGTRCCLAWYKCGGRLYCRISAQVYNELADFERMARDVLVNIETLRGGLWSMHVGTFDVNAGQPKRAAG